VTITVKGLVQGVGFRPFVYSCAWKLGLVGTVANSGRGVEIIVGGKDSVVNVLVQQLKREAPPLARVDAVVVKPSGDMFLGDSFCIIDSSLTANTTFIPPDAATCQECLEEIFSPDDRRYLYPFTNCTNCGPRLSIIRKIPYDRPDTSMDSFTMCAQCAEEYADPANRRFHAQPNGCPQCGPTLRWLDNLGSVVCGDSNESLRCCARALGQGEIVAVKGLGGFHLVVDGSNASSVKRLRSLKNRPGKPLALMAPSLKAAKTIGRFNEPASRLLSSVERPIVLVPKKDNTVLSREIAPGIDEIGIMLPYTPLHHLLFALPECPQFLVMTSGNPTGEPLCTGNDEALARLGTIADFFLIHNREIMTRQDDSVARITRGREQLIRRARGYVPRAVAVAGIPGSMLGCGAEMKNCFALTRAGQVFLSQHIGDLKNAASLDFFEHTIQKFQHLLGIRVQKVACDLHPDFLSTRYGKSLDLPLQQVQHHHAHAGAVMAEHGLASGIGVIFDGVGLGLDGTIWGGEILQLDKSSCTRVAYLRPFQLPGGDVATREIWRIGIALAKESGLDPAGIPRAFYRQHSVDSTKTEQIWQLLDRNINAPICTSVGRLFDGVASLLGVRHECSFEGQAAMEMESLARQFDHSGEAAVSADNVACFVENSSAGGAAIDFVPLVHKLMAEQEQGKDVAELCCIFHLWLVEATCRVVSRIALQAADVGEKNDTIVLGGGCFQNRLLLGWMTERLEAEGWKVYTGEQVPVNDGGLALGQLYIASLQENLAHK